MLINSIKCTYFSMNEIINRFTENEKRDVTGLACKHPFKILFITLRLRSVPAQDYIPY